MTLFSEVICLYLGVQQGFVHLLHGAIFREPGEPLRTLGVNHLSLHVTSSLHIDTCLLHLTELHCTELHCTALH